MAWTKSKARKAAARRKKWRESFIKGTRGMGSTLKPRQPTLKELYAPHGLTDTSND